MKNIPTFVVVGDVNHGKSSVVATLAENDQVRISDVPGETVVCQQFRLEDLFEFFDTPGFQNAREALVELQAAREASDPLDVFRAFVSRHEHDREFEAECRLLRPILAGAGIIYVVNGSEPIRERYLAEMEILRLTGRPRLAIINCHRRNDATTEWKRRLEQHFTVREFNAHYATFADRIALLKALVHLEQSWQEKLETAIRRLEEQWEQRLDECSEIIVELLREALTHVEREAEAESDATRRLQRTRLENDYRETLAQIENRAHRELTDVFRHGALAPDGGAFDAELFSDRTWRLFGLTTPQLALVASITLGVAGAKVGVVVDASLGGASVLAGAAIGGAVGGVLGAGGALLIGKKAPALKVSAPGRFRRQAAMRVAGAEMTVSCRAPDFPWILIDRAIGAFSRFAIGRMRGATPCAFRRLNHRPRCGRSTFPPPIGTAACGASARKSSACSGRAKMTPGIGPGCVN